jgi:hypothetical protein
MKKQASMDEKIKRFEFDVCSAQRYASTGKIEEWVHKYITTGQWANPGLAKGLKLQQRWWNGPVEVHLANLSRVVGPEEGMEYQVSADYWIGRISKMAQSFDDPLSIPPLLVEYRSGELSIRDGNTRHEAMSSLGWEKCWVIIWYNSENEYRQHSSLLLKK